MAVDNVPKEPLPDIKPRWALWTAYYLGLLDMPHQPRIWGWNPSVIVLMLAIACILVSGGYYIGHQDTVIQNIQKPCNGGRSNIPLLSRVPVCEMSACIGKKSR